MARWRGSLLAAFALMAAPVFAQSNLSLTNNPFIGSTYGSASIIGPPDPAKLWLQPGSTNTIFTSQDYLDHEGMLGVVNTAGTFQTAGHPFFEDLGSNGRGCVSCHQPSQAMSLAAANVAERWEDSLGHKLDPVFAAVDGSDCPTLPQTQKPSHSILINRGAFRIALPWPLSDAAGRPVPADFTISVIRDPNGCNSSAEYGLNRPSTHDFCLSPAAHGGEFSASPRSGLRRRGQVGRHHGGRTRSNSEIPGD